MSQHNESHQTHGNLWMLALGALGVVYGDIGTSPLYAIKEIFFSHAHIEINRVDVLGSISLVFWALTIIVSFKYVIMVLRADNDGEGGVFALYSLLQKYRNKFSLLISGLLVFAAGLLFGDGIITPAISVVSAVEGLGVVTSSFEPFIIPITIGILTGLFAIQSGGTAKIGKLFGPVVLIWFAALAGIGLFHTMHNPEILAAFNPIYIIEFLRNQELHQIMAVLGSVMLVVTGGEAMYADMGHFGRKPIRISWYAITYPALVLNYLGQGAYLLSGQPVINGNLFFSLVPSWGLIPMVILATMATIIASQALITGAFSLATQAISLNLLPYLKVIHTHKDHEGQMYVPFINWALYVGCIMLVLTFKSSTNLAAAYGLAVSGVMLITALAMVEIAIKQWKWSVAGTLALFVPLILVDLSFLVSNSIKFFAGGFVPVIIALVLYGFMKSWRWGQNWITHALGGYTTMSIQELIEIKKLSEINNDKSMVFMTYDTEKTNADEVVPVMQQVFWERTGLMPKHLIFLSVQRLRQPHAKERFDVVKFYDNKKKGSIISVVVKHGFMEEVDINAILQQLSKKHLIHIENNPEEWLIHVPQVRLLPQRLLSLKEKLKYHLYSYLSNNSTTMDQFWGPAKQANVSVQVIPMRLK